MRGGTEDKTLVFKHLYKNTLSVNSNNYVLGTNNNIKFNLYLIENTCHLRYKDRQVNNGQGNNTYFEDYTKRKNSHLHQSIKELSNFCFK
jgi:hypothetical protein